MLDKKGISKATKTIDEQSTNYRELAELFESIELNFLNQLLRTRLILYFKPH
jgi:hypothetical protein